MPARAISRDFEDLAEPLVKTCQPKYTRQPYLATAITVTDIRIKNVIFTLDDLIGLDQANN